MSFYLTLNIFEVTVVRVNFDWETSDGSIKFCVRYYHIKQTSTCTRSVIMHCIIKNYQFVLDITCMKYTIECNLKYQIQCNTECRNKVRESVW